MAGRKLKVFQAQFGFYDTVVAAPSRAAALRAWGIRQDLFASGEARETTDAAAIAAATAQPETPLRRAVGSTDPFALEPTSLPKVPDAPKKAAVKPVAKAKPNAPAKPPADRSKLDAAEKALRALDERRKAEEADLRREENELEKPARRPHRPLMSRLARRPRARSWMHGPNTGRLAAKTEAIALRASRTIPKRLRPKPTPPPPRSNRRFAR